eukprot:gene16867-20055_t
MQRSSRWRTLDLSTLKDHLTDDRVFDMCRSLNRVVGITPPTETLCLRGCFHLKNRAVQYIGASLFFAHLVHVDLEGCTSITSIQELFKPFPIVEADPPIVPPSRTPLQSLIIPSKLETTPLIAVLRYLHSITSLTVPGTSDRSILLRLLETCKLLQCLTVKSRNSDNLLSETMINRLILLSPTLQRLALINLTKTPDDCFCLIGMNMVNLTHLTISTNMELSGSTVNVILSSCPQLYELCIPFCRNVQQINTPSNSLSIFNATQTQTCPDIQFPNLTCLAISQWSLSLEETDQVFSQSNKLTQLDLSSSNITDDHLNVILSHCHRLKVIHLNVYDFDIYSYFGDDYRPPTDSKRRQQQVADAAERRRREFSSTSGGNSVSYTTDKIEKDTTAANTSNYITSASSISYEEQQSVDGNDIFDNYVHESDSNHSGAAGVMGEPPSPLFKKMVSSGTSIHIQSQLNRYTSTDFKRKDWNDEFQTLLALPNTELKFRKLSYLARDFVFAAKTYATIIINELCLPFEQKSLQPVDMGGFAGGLKYHCQGILFKFAMDSMLNEDCWMYGGPIPRDDFASKSASNELKGLISYYMADVPDLHYPLIALIDYKGFRIIALSLLPINSETIRYGSSDSGATVYSDIPHLSAKMGEAGKKLNLKPHLVGSVPECSKVLPSPGDLEAHMGKDNRYYVIDFSRTFPPEALLKREDVNKRSIFYNLLRPEFVSKWSTPLSSDAFTGWQRLDEDKSTHNKEVEDATTYLLNTVVLELADKLDKEFKGKTLNSAGTPTPGGNVQEEPSDFNEIKTQFANKYLTIVQKRFEGTPNVFAQQAAIAEEMENNALVTSLDSTNSLGAPDAPAKRYHRSLNHVKNDVPKSLLSIIEEMHRVGVNLRHMGRLRFHSQSIKLRDLLLLEMTARSIKTIIREEMRTKMKEVQGLSEEPFKQVVISMFNHVLDYRSSVWPRVRDTVMAKYPMAFNLAGEPVTEEPREGWMEAINPKNLFERVQLLAGISLSPIAQSEFSRDPFNFQFVDSDIQEIYADVKHMNIVDYAEGMALSMAAQDKRGHARERLRLLKMATSKFASALTSHPDNFDCICQLGRTLVAQAASISAVAGTFGKNMYLRTLEDASSKFLHAISISPTYAHAHYELAHVYLLIAQYFQNIPVKSMRYYKMSATSFGKAIVNAEDNSPMYATVYEDSVKLFDRGFEGASSYILGVTHLCEALEKCRPNDANVKILLARSLIYRPFYDENDEVKENYYIDAANKIQQALLVDASCKEVVLGVARDLWTKSKVGHRRLFYPTTLILRLLVERGHYSDNQIFAMYADSLFEIVRMIPNVTNPFTTELTALFDMLLKANNRYAMDRVDSATNGQHQELCDFLRMALNSPIVKSVLRESNMDVRAVSLKVTSIGDEILPMIGEVFGNHLEELDLSHCPLITDNGVSEFLTNYGKSLTSLTLAATLVSSKSIAIISTFCAAIHTLDIQNCPLISTDSLLQISHIPRLKKLDMSKCKVTNEVITSFSSHALTELKVRNENRISDECMLHFPWIHLRTLDLSSCSKISDISFIQIPPCPLIESLILEACYNLTDSTFVSIANKMPNLRKLSLKGCKFITDASVVIIAQKCIHIEDLKLSRCHSLTADSIDSISTNLAPSLLRIDLSMCPQLGEASFLQLLSRCTKLTAINFSENPHVSKATVDKVGQCFPRMQHLRLDSCTKIAEDGYETITKSNCLETLCIRKSQISHQGFLDLSTSLPNIVTLTLKACLHLTDLSFSGVGFLKNLEYLDISDNYRFLDNSMVQICYNLTRLKSVFSLANNQLYLEKLFLRECKNITQASIDYIKEKSNLFRLARLSLHSLPLIGELMNSPSERKLKPIQINDISQKKVPKINPNATKFAEPPAPPPPPPPQYQPFTEKHPYSELCFNAKSKPPNLDPQNLERYLSESEFEKLFCVNFTRYEAMPKWKRDDKKKVLMLF